MVVCICNAVSDREIRQAAALGAQTLQDLKDGLGVATCCGRCASCACQVLEQEQACALAASQLQAA
ncbi:Bacterioferritin-associated ferredoxin [compost metagenome]